MSTILIKPNIEAKCKTVRKHPSVLLGTDIFLEVIQTTQQRWRKSTFASFITAYKRIQYPQSTGNSKTKAGKIGVRLSHPSSAVGERDVFIASRTILFCPACHCSSVSRLGVSVCAMACTHFNVGYEPLSKPRKGDWRLSARGATEDGGMGREKGTEPSKLTPQAWRKYELEMQWPNTTQKASRYQII